MLRHGRTPAPRCTSRRGSESRSGNELAKLGADDRVIVVEPGRVEAAPPGKVLDERRLDEKSVLGGEDQARRDWAEPDDAAQNVGPKLRNLAQTGPSDSMFVTTMELALIGLAWAEAPIDPTSTRLRRAIRTPPERLDAAS